MKTAFLATGLVALTAAAPAFAEMELSIYSGWQTSPHSTFKGDFPDSAGGGDFDRGVEWDGKSFEMPPYYGVRFTNWQTERLGYGVEFTHSKVYLSDDDQDALGFDNFQLTDGLNVLTVNAMYRWPDQFGTLTPYVGGGLGVTIPHVDSQIADSDTYGYQFGGPAVRLTAGASYDLNDRVAVFGEYQFTASQNDLDLDDGGSVKTDVKTNAVNLGLTLKF